MQVAFHAESGKRANRETEQGGADFFAVALQCANPRKRKHDVDSKRGRLKLEFEKAGNRATQQVIIAPIPELIRQFKTIDESYRSRQVMEVVN